MRAIAVIAVAVAGGLTAASPGTAATPEAAVGPSTTAEPVGTADVPSGIYRIRNLGRPGYCMRRDPSIPLANGPLVIMAECSTGDILIPLETWRFESVPGTDPRWRGVFNGVGGCLDADRKGNRLTRVVHVIPCNVNPRNGSQLWDFPDPGTAGIVCSAMRFCEASDAVVLTDDQDPPDLLRVNLHDIIGCVCQLFFLERVG